MKKVRWGILGAGGIADRRTLPGMQLAEHAEIVSVMEIDPAFAERLREKYHAKRAYSDDAALLSDPEIDAVYTQGWRRWRRTTASTSSSKNPSP